MKTLSPDLRRQLERAITKARGVAETGARVALETLAVHHHEPYGHMGAEQRALRRRLRVHARQLGDRLDAHSGSPAIDRLVHECAYEYWHGMLFARFLAENDLLIEPEMGITVSLDECEELAGEQGVDKWALASRFAQRLLPQVFRPDHPVFEVRFAREHRLKLESLVEGLPADLFRASDSLGWVYQFWQSRKKDEVNRSEVKIGAGELPAVTQLFTEPYMVRFLLHNSLGAWWVGRHPDKRCPVELTYLRKTEEGAPAAGRFEGWPDDLSELRLLDPCCGSGHFLVAAFLMLVPMRMALENLSAAEAVDAVLRDNLHGLELDPRCVALAAFSLALAAWTFPGAGGYRTLPKMNLACSGLAPNSPKKQWLALAETAAAAGGMPPERDLFGVDDSLLSAPLRDSLSVLYDLFARAPELGSLIDPGALQADLFQGGFDSVRALLAEALEQERTTDEQTERAVAARGMAHAAELLAGRYHGVITNVPYLARGRHGERLRAFCELHYPDAKNDLATVFLERCLELCAEGGTASLVLPQNWLFLTRYRNLRKKLLKTETWRLLARLGPGAFETISGEVVKAILLTLSRGYPTRSQGGVLDDASAPGMMYGLDVSESRTASEKAKALREAEIKGVEQARQLENPDAIVKFEVSDSTEILGQFARCNQGISTADSPRFICKSWELFKRSDSWDLYQMAPNSADEFSGIHSCIRWDGGEGPLANSRQSRICGQPAWGQRGIGVAVTRNLNVCHYMGHKYDVTLAVITPLNKSSTGSIVTFVQDKTFPVRVKEVDQALSVTESSFLKVPFEPAYWAINAQERFFWGLPKPYSNDLTQWIFHGHPCGSVVWDGAEKRTAQGPLRTDPTVLQVAAARLLGYRWPAERDAGMELADEQRAWARRCAALRVWADEDGVVCIPSVRGEPPAGERLLQLLAAAFGDVWSGGVLSKLLAEAGSPSLDDWLRNRFFEQHCKLFHHRPFVWHVWDGRKRDGFHALVNYHKLAEDDGRGRRLLESLTYSYLGDWISRQRDGVKRGEGGAEDRLAAALELQKRLVAILEGEPPFDLFIRWKPVAEQPIGWEPDINDGVRLNIRSFLAGDIPGGKKGAGILRTKPNIHWKKDRGKEP